ncbi:hypothetical protein AB0Q95_41875 [Streptomyces sp. NPDC059900]|uniref:hypothetical protein n=1 Tax=Streptomyces sp. NPDC059900 TaxID=3155816 RepID=UPI003423CCFA
MTGKSELGLELELEPLGVGFGKPVAVLLAEAVRGGQVDAEAQRRVLAAFRSARRARRSSLPTRPGDDWR